MTERLSQRALGRLPARVKRPAYDRTATQIGIVHIGAGNFHRAHQAAYLDDVLIRERGWAICAASLNSTGVRDILAEQDFLYTLAIRDRTPELRIIGAIKDVLAARDQQQQILQQMSTLATRIVSLTITEKGYCLDGQGDLDLAHPAIRHDLRNPENPASAIGYIARGLQLRRDAGLPPVTILSCDNLNENGTLLAHAVRQYAEAIAPDLARWIEDQVPFPNSMVDSITPATDEALKADVAHVLSLRDGWPVQREAFSQWVIEDRFATGCPDWEPFGVIMTNDVRLFEAAKLRLVNAPHSALAYLGSLAGFETVDTAVADTRVSRFLQAMMTEDIIPSLMPPPGLDLVAYRDTILNRFRNPAIRHSLLQVAQDGSLKLPIRILETIKDNLGAGRGIARLALVAAGWMLFVQTRVAQKQIVVDPQASRLAQIAAQHSHDAPDTVDAFLSLKTIFPEVLTAQPQFRAALLDAYRSLGTGHRQEVLRAVAQAGSA